MKIKVWFAVVTSAVFLCACESETARTSVNLPDANSEGGKLFKKYCSACHAPPRPSSHQADEWNNIVDRMQNHRIKKAYNPLSDLEKATLVQYLEKHSAKNS